MRSDPRRLAASLAGRWRRLPRPARLLLAPACFLAPLIVGWLRLDPFGPPDLGDPFDVEAFGTVSVPDEENAYVLYRQADALLAPFRRTGGRIWVEISALVKDDDLTWPRVGPDVRAFVADCRPALDLWRRGTERPGALEHPLKGMTFETNLMWLDDDLRAFGRLAVLEGVRLEGEGDPAGAWGWYRATLRSGRHLGMHGVVLGRIIGSVQHRLACPHIEHWASDPRVDATLLRRALREIIAIDAMTPPDTEPLKGDYCLFMNELENPTDSFREDFVARTPGLWYRRFDLLARYSDPVCRGDIAAQRSRARRLVRLYYANWLGHFSRPPRLRSRPVSEEPRIYVSESGPPPEALIRWREATPLASWLLADSTRIYETVLDRERRDQAHLVLTLAEQLYRRDHGRPPGTLGDLIGPDLPALPEGYEPGDAPPGVSP